MCRLLAYVAGREQSLQDTVGKSALADFRSLARIHGDGWGVAWTSADEPPRIAMRHSITSAATDPAFASSAKEVCARAAFLHLRWASGGLGVNLANTHPFLADGWAFAHNGFIPGSERVLALLPTRHRSSLSGTTDSERFFRLVLACAERTGDIVTGLQTAGQLVRDIAGAMSINSMLLSPSRLLAVQGLSGAQPPVTELLARVEQPDQLPLNHIEGYFQLAYRQSGDGLVIASSGLPTEGWTLLPPDSVMDVDVPTGQWTRRPLIPETDRVPGESASAAETERT